MPRTITTLLNNFIFIAIVSLSFTTSVYASTFTVTKTADTNDGVCDIDCSLREAIILANTTSSNDIIEFDAVVFNVSQVIILTEGQLSVINNGSLVINGNTTSHISISGNNSSRVFFIDRMSTVTLNNLFVINGNGSGQPQTFSGSGAGIFNLEGSLSINNSTIRNNSALAFQDGGGICNAGGTVTLVNSLVNDNRTNTGTGGGIYNFTSTGIITIINSTITNNSASSGGGVSSIFGTINLTNTTIAFNSATGSTGGGIINNNGTVNIRNTIVANNSSGVTGSDVFGTLISQGYNLIENTTSLTITGTNTGNILGQDPQMLPLGSYGGLAKTHALRSTSPAIDKGNNFNVMMDQRGKLRPYDNPRIQNSNGGNGADIGAFERQVFDFPLGVSFDFDGDVKADLSVFRPLENTWYLHQSILGFYAASFGVSTDKIVPADYDGDSRTDIAVFRDGNWFQLNSSNNSFSAVLFGQMGDLPVPADFDGDGKADISVYRASTGNWYRLNSSDNSFTSVPFGTAEDKPQIGDFDGDGKADICVFRPSTGVWYRLNSSNGQFVAVNFGISTDLTIPADYDGDGKTDIAVYRQGNWYRLNSSDNSFTGVAFGNESDKPVPADYDGDGKADIGVFRPLDGTWYLLRSTAGFTAQHFGTNGDTPTPNAFVR